MDIGYDVASREIIGEVKMKVSLVSITAPQIDGITTPEELIVYCARVSNPKNQKNTATAPRLIKYLIDHKHWSPFEMASMCVEIETSRAIAQQILRHRSFSFQEFCLASNSRVLFADGSSMPIAEMYERRKELKGRELVCLDTTMMSFIKRPLKQVYKRRKQPVQRIVLRNGYSLYCTPDHYLFTGSVGWCRAQYLHPVYHPVACHMKGIKYPVHINLDHKADKYTYEDVTYDLAIDTDDEALQNFVANGMVVHNSQRYAPVTKFEEVELRKQAEKNRQSSTDVITDEGLSIEIKEHIERCEKLYRSLLDKGVAKETARFVLPLTTQTRMYMHGTIRSWITYLMVRLGSDTQKEHRLIAQKIAEIFKEEFPVIYEALNGFSV